MTPDLEAKKATARTLCEVKTINISDPEANRRFSGGVANITDRLDDKFLEKFSSVLEKAKAQMTAFDADPAVTKLAYVVINFDDQLHEYADRYRVQIERYMAVNPTPGLEVVLYWKPPFYFAEA
jgi:hypothetical protein